MKNIRQLTKPLVSIYSDGSCPAQGDRSGGWAAVLAMNGQRRVIGGYVRDTTNNQMELVAVLESLRQLKCPCSVRIVTDSVNVIGWLYGWDVKNKCPDPDHLFKAQGAIKTLREIIWTYAYENGHDLYFDWVKGHEGHPENELADRIADRVRRNHLEKYDTLGV